MTTTPQTGTGAALEGATCCSHTNAANWAAAGGASENLPFRVSEYECCWLAAGKDWISDDEQAWLGGDVSVRVARTGSQDDDYIVSDETANSMTEAVEIARRLIHWHETECE